MSEHRRPLQAVADLSDIDSATRYFFGVALRVGLIGSASADPWQELDGEVERLTGRNPSTLSPRDWIALAAALQEVPR